MDNQQRGREADRLLNGEVFSDVLEACHARFVKEWITAETAIHREMCHAKVIGLVEIQRQLRRIIGEGEHASHVAKAAEAAGLPQD